MRNLVSLLFALALSAPGARAATPAEIVASAPASAWTDIAAEDLLIMEFGDGKRVIIQLSTQFSDAHVANIRKLATAHWWDGASIYRVQDNYVVQWGDRSEKKPLPDGVAKTLPEEYSVDRKAVEDRVTIMPSSDSYAKTTGFLDGWPVAMNAGTLWPIHCYGMVGAGRNLAPDAGNGAELYAVIGHAPRHLDRNIALVGRVVEGMEHFSSLSRGTQALGMYGPDQTAVPILSVRLASDLPRQAQPHFQMLDTRSKIFADYARVRENRHDAFFAVPAGGADICNIPVPMRRRPDS
ncbi:MAG TPA: peptidylprolyl isomerase [Sphingobium sp.]